jgi:serine/threonine protein kinase
MDENKEPNTENKSLEHPSDGEIDPLLFFSRQSIHETRDFDSVHESDKSSVNHSRADHYRRELPKILGKYRIVRLLGEGAFGRVFLGEDDRIGRQAAIKLCEIGDKSNGLAEGFLHEAKSIARLSHPNIVGLLQADETEDGTGYLVYEFVNGRTLDEVVRQEKYTIEQAITWIASISEALDYAHRRGVVHRDISPRNIMISTDGQAKLLDFGLSSIDVQFHRDDQNRILGTPGFLSPEQAVGNPHWATSYSDLFSLGSVLYYALTKRLPFPGTNLLDILERTQKAAPASPRSVAANIPSEVEAVCLRAMAKEPQGRYSTGADFSAALLNALHESTKARMLLDTKAFPTTETLPSLWASPLIWTGMMLLLAGLGLGAYVVEKLTSMPALQTVAQPPGLGPLDIASIELYASNAPINLMRPGDPPQFDMEADATNDRKPLRLSDVDKLFVKFQSLPKYNRSVFLYSGDEWRSIDPSGNGFDVRFSAPGVQILLLTESFDSISEDSLPDQPLFFQNGDEKTSINSRDVAKLTSRVSVRSQDTPRAIQGVERGVQGYEQLQFDTPTKIDGNWRWIVFALEGDSKDSSKTENASREAVNVHESNEFLQGYQRISRNAIACGSFAFNQETARYRVAAHRPVDAYREASNDL